MEIEQFSATGKEVVKNLPTLLVDFSATATLRQTPITTPKQGLSEVLLDRLIFIFLKLTAFAIDSPFITGKKRALMKKALTT